MRNTFFYTLRKAIFYFQELGTIQTHYDPDHLDSSTKIKETEANPGTPASNLVFTDEYASISSYDLIVSSEGTHFILKSKYTGNFALSKQW